MGKEISDDDYLELQRRRLIDSVTESVESVLRKRYTWLAVIVSFLIGGGVATAVINLTSDAQKALIETEALLGRAKNSIDLAENLSGSVQEKYLAVSRDLDGLFEGKNIFLDRLSETNKRMDDMDTRLAELTKTLNSLINKTSVSGEIKNIPLNAGNQEPKNIQQKIEMSRYTIYMHYTDERDLEVIKELAEELRKTGYVIPNIRKVDYRVMDIRYFKKDDESEAWKIKKQVVEFLKKKNITANTDIPVKNLGENYKNVREGSIELWLCFSDVEKRLD
jgi:hypothetical protein